MQFIQTIQLIVAYHALILSMVLIIAKGPKSLSLFCSVFALHMFANINADYGIFFPNINITSAFGLAYAPLMYLFVRELCFEDSKLRFWPDLLHFAPSILVALIRPADPIPQMIGFPLLVGYCAFIFHNLREHADATKHIRSDDDAIALKWVSIVFFAFMVIAIFDVTRASFPNIWPITDDQALAITLLSVIALLSVMAWKSIIHKHTKGALTVEERYTAQVACTPPDDQEAAAKAFTAIDTIVKRDQLWREPRLTLDNVAEATAHTPREVSRAINLIYKTSFSSYINRLRVEYVDSLMDDNTMHGRTLLDLSYEAGFNSKSAFNRHYKAVRGEPPSRTLERKRASTEHQIKN